MLLPNTLSDRLKLEFLIALLKNPDRLQRVRVPDIAHGLGWTGKQRFGFQPGLDTAKEVARELTDEGIVDRWKADFGSPWYIALMQPKGQSPKCGGHANSYLLPLAVG